MPQKPVNFDYAIAALREEAPPEALAPRLRQTLSNPARPQIRLRAIGMTCAAVGAAFILWPRAGTNSAWAQTIGQTESAKIVHRVGYDRNGHVNFEMWKAPNRRSDYGLTRDGKVMFEAHWDGKRLFNYADIQPSLSLPNATKVASVSHLSKDMWIGHVKDEDFLTGFLTDNKAKVKGHQEVSTSHGKMNRYVVATGRGDEVEIDAETTSKRIVQVRSKKFGTLEKIEYPDQIPAEVFEPRPHVIKNVAVYDYNKLSAQVHQDLEHGIATKNGTEIRFAGIDSEGNLWVLWTGSIPDSQLSKPFRAPGVSLGQAYGMPTFTTKRESDKMSSISSIVGQPMGGMARPVRIKVGNKLDLEIPTDHGYVRFSQVPILRFGYLFDFEQMLGFRRS